MTDSPPLAPLARDGLAIRVEGVEEGGAISVRIRLAGAADRAQVEAEITRLLRDDAIERAVIWSRAGRNSATVYHSSGARQGRAASAARIS